MPSGLRLPTSLGKFLIPTHRPMDWYTNEERSVLACKRERGTRGHWYDVYTIDITIPRTRHGSQFVWSWSARTGPTQTSYASIQRIDQMRITLHSIATMPVTVPIETDFWTVLRSFENQSLWKNFVCDGDGSWIHQGMRQGTLTIVHDGSYMKELDKNVCSAGFMIFCSRTKCQAKGAVAEWSENADNYRAEILGGVLIQLVLRAASRTPNATYEPVEIDCNNQGAVTHGNTATRVLKAKQEQADILRSFKQLVMENSFKSEFKWVASHQDDTKNGNISHSRKR